MRLPSLLRLFLLLFLLSPSLLSAQWTKTNGLTGGSVSSFLRFGDTVIVNAGRLHYSTDDGQSWAPLKASGCYYTYQLAKEGNNLYAYGERVGAGRVVSWSADFGQTWTWAPLPANLYFDSFIATNGFLYGNNNQYIYRSADHGVHWDTLPTSWIYHLQAEEQRMVGNRSNVVVESLDGGFTWDTLLHCNGYIIDIVQHENYLFVFQQNANAGCWTSSDYGQTWQHFTGTAFDQFYDFVWHEGTIFGMKGRFIYKSVDMGANWSFIEYPSETVAYKGVSSSGSILIGGSKGVLRSTDNGENWISSNQGLLSATPPRLNVVDQGLFAPALGGIFQLQADNVSWSNLNYPIGSAWDQIRYTTYLRSGNNLVLCVGAKIPWVSTDAGITWSKSILPDSWNDAGSATLLSLAGGQILAILDNGDYISSYISDDHGLTFYLLSTLAEQFDDTFIQHFDINAGQVYILANDGNIYQSSDGHQWSVLSDNVPTDSLYNWQGYSSRVFVRGNSIWVFASGKLGFSTDLGQTWSIYTLSSAGFVWGTSGFRDLLQVNDYLFAATNQGIFYSNDGGLNWTDWSEGLEMQVGNTLQVYEDYIWAGMDSDGIWKRPLSDLGISATKPIVGLVPSLPLYVFPNPATDVARLDLSTAGLLTVTDAAGRIMWKNQVTAGLTELKVRNWPTGTYHLLFNNGKKPAQGLMMVQH